MATPWSFSRFSSSLPIDSSLAPCKDISARIKRHVCLVLFTLEFFHGIHVKEAGKIIRFHGILIRESL